MKSGFYRTRQGTERLWFKPEDIEFMMEEELRKARLYPTIDKPAVDIERVLVRHLRVELDQHAELDPQILGLTEFPPGASPRVQINRDLTNAIDSDQSTAGLVGRWRATFAHEASHVILHHVLFQLDGSQTMLFNVKGAQNAEPQRLMRCMKKDVLYRGGQSDWREVQANMGMAALLMPQMLFRQLVAAALVRLGIRADDLVPGSAPSATLAADLAAVCEVSKQAAAIRLESLKITCAAGQGLLVQSE